MVVNKFQQINGLEEFKMAFCSKCGATINGEKFCPACGAPQQYQQTGAPQGGAQGNFDKFMDTPNTTGEFDPNDISQNKAMAVLSYLAILVLIPILAAPESKFARYHANQGLTLFITEIAYVIVESVLGLIFGLIPVVGGILNGILGLVHIVFLVLAVLGIINAANGEAKELPLIGKFKLLK